MRKVYTIGETLLDIIFQPDKSIVAKPGGSMLNSAVSLGRMEIPVCLISEYADDKTGQLITEFLTDNNVNLEFIQRFDGHTPLALAFLDDSRNAEYSFYHWDSPHTHPYKRPQFSEDDILIFGSFYSLMKENRPWIRKLLKAAKAKGMLILYDPNFRKPHLNDLQKAMHAIIENISFADVIRGSDEDFEYIFNKTVPEDVYKIVQENGCNNLVYTKGDKGVILLTERSANHYKTPEVNLVSTIGAGDSFNAGIIYGFYQQNVTKQTIRALQEKEWDKIIRTGIDFATCVCESDENYISEDFAETYKAKGK